MEKKLLILVGIVLVAVIASFVFIRPNQHGKKTVAQQEELSITGKVGDNKDACALLTLEEIKKVFPENDMAQVGAVQNFQNSTTTTSDCRYSANPQDPAKAINVQIMVQTSNNEIAKNNFISSKTQTAENIQGVGEQAYWDPATLKLNVLNNNRWIMISVGSTILNGKELVYAKQIADSI